MDGAADKSSWNLGAAVEHQHSTLRDSWWPQDIELETESEGKREREGQSRTLRVIEKDGVRQKHERSQRRATT